MTMKKLCRVEYLCKVMLLKRFAIYKKCTTKKIVTIMLYNIKNISCLLFVLPLSLFTRTTLGSGAFLNILTIWIIYTASPRKR